MNALTDTRHLPPFGRFTPADVAPALDILIRDLRDAVDVVLKPRPTDFESAWLPIEAAIVALTNAWSAVDYLNAVMDSPDLRVAVAENQPKLVEMQSFLSQNMAFYDLCRSLKDGSGYADLEPEDQAALDQRLREFLLSGIALPPEKKVRVAEIDLALSQISNAFSSAVLDATQAWTRHITDEHELAGIPDSDKSILAAYARAAGVAGWLVTLQPASLNAVMTYAEDRMLRYDVYEAFGTRASDQGPHAGFYDNGPRIAEIMALRREAASLLGFANPADLYMTTRMAQSTAEVRAFLVDLAGRARPVAERQLSELRSFAAEELRLDELQPWDMGFVSERLRRARYAVDDAEVKTFFPVDTVLSGWQSLLTDLFGIVLEKRSDVPLWHSDAAYYDVRDTHGAVIAGLYLDLHARQGKRGGAWMAPARPRNADPAQGVPVAYLTCNFPPRDDDGIALLSHSQVSMLLHETGHCLQHLLTRVDRFSVGGISGVEWDAIELPSQLMEDFAWDFATLRRMSAHYRSGETIPEALFEKMQAARRFSGGLRLLGNIELSLFDLDLHMAAPGDSAMEVLSRVRDEVAIIRPPEWNRFPCAFTHIFAGGYAAGYYSYLWAEWFAADGFNYFVEHGTVNRAVADQLRKEILERGSVRPAKENFIAFRGRMPELGPLLVRYGLE
ncbi:MAG TPA: M3 family metallopeptidase [Sphingobium sp.]|uniref:M3 family metallopeptidase n=1 Tax=Sphingobium sp. TaxID=1912891 RepID=UPI002ED1597A